MIAISDKIKKFGRQVPAILIAIILVAGAVSAMLIVSHTSTIGTVEVKPLINALTLSVSKFYLIVDKGKNECIDASFTVTNNASVNISTYLNTSVLYPDGSITYNYILGQDGFKIDIAYDFYRPGKGCSQRGKIAQPIYFPPGDTNMDLLIKTQGHKLAEGNYTISIWTVLP